MKIVWKLTQIICNRYELPKVNIFILLNILAFSVMAYVISNIVIILNPLSDVNKLLMVILIMGYGVAIGMFSSVIYLLLNDIRDDRKVTE